MPPFAFFSTSPRHSRSPGLVLSGLARPPADDAVQRKSCRPRQVEFALGVGHPGPRKADRGRCVAPVLAGRRHPVVAASRADHRDAKRPLQIALVYPHSWRPLPERRDLVLFVHPLMAPRFFPRVLFTVESQSVRCTHFVTACCAIRTVACDSRNPHKRRVEKKGPEFPDGPLLKSLGGSPYICPTFVHCRTCIAMQKTMLLRFFGSAPACKTYHERLSRARRPSAMMPAYLKCVGSNPSAACPGMYSAARHRALHTSRQFSTVDGRGCRGHATRSRFAVGRLIIPLASSTTAAVSRPTRTPNFPQIGARSPLTGCNSGCHFRGKPMRPAAACTGLVSVVQCASSRWTSGAAKPRASARRRARACIGPPKSWARCPTGAARDRLLPDPQIFGDDRASACPLSAGAGPVVPVPRRRNAAL